MLVKCNRICWDGATSRKYHPGDQDDIDPLSPIAMYFDFPDGTEVYYKIKGKRGDKDGKGGTPNIETTRTVGQPFPIVRKEDPIYMCNICNEYTNTSEDKVLKHMERCAKK